MQLEKYVVFNLQEWQQNKQKKKLNNVVDVQGVVECFLDRYQMTAKYVTYDTPEDDVQAYKFCQITQTSITCTKAEPALIFIKLHTITKVILQRILKICTTVLWYKLKPAHCHMCRIPVAFKRVPRDSIDKSGAKFAAGFVLSLKFIDLDEVDVRKCLCLY